MQRFEGKAVLVTGASTGIGAALALAYAAQKSRVALHYNSSREAAEKLAKTIRDGVGLMPAVANDWTLPEVNAVVQYVRTKIAGGGAAVGG